MTKDVEVHQEQGEYSAKDYQNRNHSHERPSISLRQWSLEPWKAPLLSIQPHPKPIQMRSLLASVEPQNSLHHPFPSS
ncbi:unnamed protein product [Lupinus luteus]|uniref:Uncharacterized protein n=1 Tax=Lupinus luteus TaxID=3873 RepID=A0AAV1W1J5_LUPLU